MPDFENLAYLFFTVYLYIIFWSINTNWSK